MDKKKTDLIKAGLFDMDLSGFGMADNGLANPFPQTADTLWVWILGSEEPQSYNERGAWFADGIWLDTAIWYK